MKITIKIIFPLFLLISQYAQAKVVKLDECVVNVFGFCPFETIGIAIALIASLLFAGFPLRWVIKRHFHKQLQGNSSYEPDPVLLFFYRYSGHIVIGLILLILLLIFSKP